MAQDASTAKEIITVFTKTKNILTTTAPVTSTQTAI
jgi:hypothetical protein